MTNNKKIVDLRSDTVTLPTQSMRTAMADAELGDEAYGCLLYTSPSPRDGLLSRMPSSA